MRYVAAAIAMFDDTPLPRQTSTTIDYAADVDALSTTTPDYAAHFHDPTRAMITTRLMTESAARDANAADRRCARCKRCERKRRAI